MFTTDLVNLYNKNIFKTSLYIYIFQDEKCRLMRNLSLSMIGHEIQTTLLKIETNKLFLYFYNFSYFSIYVLNECRVYRTG